jgi:hypothetical protein
MDQVARQVEGEPAVPEQPGLKARRVGHGNDEYPAGHDEIRRVPQRPDRPASFDSIPFRVGPPTCCPPGIYRDAAATATPRSTSRAKSSICRGSSQPSAIVTTATGAAATSMPNLIALAGPRPYVSTTQRIRGSLSAYPVTTGIVLSSSESTTMRTSHGRCTDSNSRSKTGRMCSLSS